MAREGLHYVPIAKDRLRDPRVDPILVAHGYGVRSRPSVSTDSLLTSGVVNAALLRGASAPVEMSNDPFHLDVAPAVAAWLEHRHTPPHGVFYNGERIRQCSDVELVSPGALAPLRLQPARYFDTVFSNDSTGISLYSPGEREPSFDGRQLCFPEETIWSCGDHRRGRAGDALGASVVAVTTDRRLVLVRQSTHSKLSPGLLAPSGSGGGDWSDCAAPGGLAGLATQIALRELEEECGIARTDIVAVKVLGYGRFLQRGGKPEFFALARLGCAAHEIKVARSERLLVEGHELVGLPPDAPSAGAALQLAAAELRRDRPAEMSSSLWWNLELLLEAEAAVLDPMFDGL